MSITESAAIRADCSVTRSTAIADSFVRASTFSAVIASALTTIAAALAATPEVLAVPVTKLAAIAVALVARLVVTLALNAASSPNALASSFNVSNAPGAPLIKLATCWSTYALFVASVGLIAVPTSTIVLPFISILSPNWTATPSASVMFFPLAICSVAAIDNGVLDASVSTPVPSALTVIPWSMSALTTIVPESSSSTFWLLMYNEPCDRYKSLHFNAVEPKSKPVVPSESTVGRMCPPIDRFANNSEASSVLKPPSIINFLCAIL